MGMSNPISSIKMIKLTLIIMVVANCINAIPSNYNKSSSGSGSYNDYESSYDYGSCFYYDYGSGSYYDYGSGSYDSGSYDPYGSGSYDPNGSGSYGSYYNGSFYPSGSGYMHASYGSG